MSEENIFDNITELKTTNPWISNFDLSDEEVREVMRLIVKIVMGSIGFDKFLSELKRIVKRDDKYINQLAITIAKNRFLVIEDDLGDVKGFIKKLGGNVDVVLQPNDNLDSVGNSKFSFSMEDEDEVEKFRGVAGNGKKYDYESLSKLILEEFSYPESDDVFRKRFISIVGANLRGVRDDMETKDVLIKNKKVGGLEFTDKQVENLLKLIKQKKQAGLFQKKLEIKEDEKLIFPLKEPFQQKEKIDSGIKKDYLPAREKVAIRDNKEDLKEKKQADYDIVPQIEEEDGLPVIKMSDDLILKPKEVNLKSSVVSTRLSNNNPASDSNLPIKKDLPTAGLKNSLQNTPKKISSQKSIGVKKDLPSPQPAPYVSQSLRSSYQSNQVASRKPTLDDVKFNPKLSGPVEELAKMTLIDFRRISQKPGEVIRKIKEKIDLLEKDSYSRKVEGIDAWKRNEINKFYRMLGQIAMAEGRTIEEIIIQRLEEKKPTLSLEEFEAVMELNRQLRY